MEKENRKISLGFTQQSFEPGVHICQIYNEEDERHNALINYVISGIKNNETTACFTEKETENTLKEFFEKNGIQYKEVEQNGKFTLHKTAEVYFEGGIFEPERMLGLLKEFYNNSVEKKFSGARVIGEMIPEIENIPGGSRLMEYESKVSLLLKQYPVTAVCQYDARSFDGSTILDILKVHPYMIIKGEVVNNPFFIPPEEFLAQKEIK